MRRSHRWLQLIGCVLLFLWTPLSTGCVMNLAWVRQVPALSDNLETFREMKVPAERLRGFDEWEERDYRQLTRDFLYHDGKIPKGEKSLSPLSWYGMLLPEKTEAPYSKAWQTVLSDIKCFPVMEDPKGNESIRFEDSWGMSRSYGGKRIHEGTDLMPSIKERGYFSVVSVSDGIVEKKGWLKLGGYRLGIRSRSGAYFYYAHLADYAEGIQEGSSVTAGQIIGSMGDSGYGKEGTVGKFAVHLHFGIYINIGKKEISVNPYEVLRAVEGKKSLGQSQIMCRI